MLQYKSSIVDGCMFVTEYNLPSEESVKLATRYTEPVISQKSKEQVKKYCQEYMKSAHASETRTSPQLLSNDKNQSITIGQLFSPDGDGITPKTVILCGDSGRGKSFILQKIMLEWASGELYSENFDVVFLLNCEELRFLSEEMTLTELLRCSCSLTSDEISEKLESTPEKVLFLIDGVNEYKYHQCSDVSSPHTNPAKRAHPLVIIRNLLRGILQPQSFMLITTISVAANALMDLLRGPRRFIEIEGFSERGVQEYFQKFFQDEQLFRKTYKSVKTNETLLTNCSVPLLCWMVCFCVKKHKKDQVIKELNTTTSIYAHFLSTMLEDHDHSESLLRSLGQLAKEGTKKRQILFDVKSVTKTGLDPATSVFLLKTKVKHEPAFRFMHPSFQKFFTALHFFRDKNHWWKTSKRLSSYLISSNHLLFIYGLINKKVQSQLFKGSDWTSSDMRLKTELQKELLKIISVMLKHCRVKLLALHCVYELQDEEFTKTALAGWVSVNLSNVALRSTVCLVLLYCLRFSPNFRDLNLMYCDLTTDKLKILQPVLTLCETLRLSVDHLSEVRDVIQSFVGSKIWRNFKVQGDGNCAESPRWSIDLSSAHGDILLSLTFSKKNPLFPTVLNISITCALSSTDWTHLLQRFSRAGKLAENFSQSGEHVHLLLSSFQSLSLKTMDLKLVSLNESWASGIINFFQNCNSLQQLRVSVRGLKLEEGLKLLKNSLTDPHCTVISKGRNSCNKKVKIQFKQKDLDKLEQLNISEAPTLDLHSQSCVHIADSDQWLQGEPSVCGDEEGGSEFRINTQEPPVTRDMAEAVKWVRSNRHRLRGPVKEPRFLEMNKEDKEKALTDLYQEMEDWRVPFTFNFTFMDDMETFLQECRDKMGLKVNSSFDVY